MILLPIWFISVVAYMGLIYLGLMFVFKAVIRRGVVEEEEMHKGAGVREEDVKRMFRVIMPYLNESLLQFRALFSGDLSTTLKPQPSRTYGGQEARKLEHNYIGSGHLLLAFISDGRCLAHLVLAKLGVNASNIRTTEVIRMVGENNNETIVEMKSYQLIVDKVDEELREIEKKLSQVEEEMIKALDYEDLEKGIALDILVAMGVIKSLHFWLEVEQIQEAIQKVLVCVEMVIFASEPLLLFRSMLTMLVLTAGRPRRSSIKRPNDLGPV